MAMSHGVHAVQHEVEHQIEHDEHGHGGGHGTHEKPKVENNNKKIALLIAVIALFLAFSETLGKSAQTMGIELNIKASDTWNFFQAKTIRQTTLRTAAEAMTIEVTARPDDAFKAAMTKQIEAWRATVARYESDPKEQDGRRELMAMAKKYEAGRDLAMARYHNYEYASAAFQIGIVMASAAVITGMMALVFAAGGIGILGIVFMGIGLFAPEVPHDVAHWFQNLFAGGAAH
jgi:hypothetical protein